MLGRETPPHRLKDDRLPPWRKNGLKKRANFMEMTSFLWKDVMNPGSNVGIKLKTSTAVVAQRRKWET